MAKSEMPSCGRARGYGNRLGAAIGPRRHQLQSQPWALVSVDSIAWARSPALAATPVARRWDYRPRRQPRCRTTSRCDRRAGGEYFGHRDRRRSTFHEWPPICLPPEGSPPNTSWNADLSTLPTMDWSTERLWTVTITVSPTPFPVVCKECPFYGTTFESGAGARTAWHTRQEGLLRWLKTLAKPVAIVAWTTELGREVIHACRRAGILVPEQVAVLAADNDDLLCEACTPSLSGIALTSERIGYEAATLLERLMQGRRPPKKPDSHCADRHCRPTIDRHAGRRRRRFGSSFGLYPRSCRRSNPSERRASSGAGVTSPVGATFSGSSRAKSRPRDPASSFGACQAASRGY